MSDDLKLTLMILAAILILILYIWDAHRRGWRFQWMSKAGVGHTYAANSIAIFAMVGRRFCKVDMRGCMAETRGQEKWGTIIAIDIGRTERGLVYDGHQSQEMREHYRKKGQDTWARIRYDDGTESYEPVWWFIEQGSHLEYQT
jgi:hypothetical protein